MEKGKEHASPITPAIADYVTNLSTQMIPRSFYPLGSMPTPANPSTNLPTQVMFLLNLLHGFCSNNVCTLFFFCFQCTNFEWFCM
ncbi:hypothetical protein I3760_08G078900 [Carya illinoinensis]|nr:hypothetical protein I3760_08G078900 [Carya illinoinensis]